MSDNYNVPLRRPLTQAVEEALRDATGRPVGIVEAPLKADGSAEDLPYAVIHPYETGRYFGTYTHPQADGSFGYMIHSYGLRADQAEWMSDKVVSTMIGRDSSGNYVYPITPDGMGVMERRIAESPGPSRNHGKIFIVIDMFIVSVTTS